MEKLLVNKSGAGMGLFFFCCFLLFFFGGVGSWAYKRVLVLKWIVIIGVNVNPAKVSTG